MNGEYRRNPRHRRQDEKKSMKKSTPKRHERPCAVSEYLLERMILGGADKICFIISPGKSDILEYFGDSYGGASIVYVVQRLGDASPQAFPHRPADEDR